MNFKRKVFVLALLVTFALSLFSGCNPGEKPKPTPTTSPKNSKVYRWPIGIDFSKMKNKTFLRMDKASWATDWQYYDLWDKNFYETYGVKARDTSRPSPFETEKLALLVASGDGPALVSAGPGEYPIWPARGLLKEVDGWMNPDDNTFHKGLLNGLSYNGKHYFLQAADYAPASGIVYNHNMFLSQGLELPRELAKKGQWTYDKFREYARLWNVDENQDGVYERYGYETGRWEAWFASNDASFYEVKPDGSLVNNMKNPKTTEVWDFLKAGVQSKEFKWGWDGINDIETGKCVMLSGGMNYAFDEMGFSTKVNAKQNGFKYDWAPMPRSKSNVNSDNPHDTYVPFMWARAIGQNAKNAEIGFAWYWYWMSHHEDILIDGKAQQTFAQRLEKMNPVQRELHLLDEKIRSGAWPQKLQNFSGCPNFGWEDFVWQVVVYGGSYAAQYEKNLTKMEKALKDLKKTEQLSLASKPIIPPLQNFNDNTLGVFTASTEKNIKVSLVQGEEAINGISLKFENNTTLVNTMAPAIFIRPVKNKFLFSAVNNYRITLKYKVLKDFIFMRTRGISVWLLDKDGNSLATVNQNLRKKEGELILENLNYDKQSLEQTVSLAIGISDKGVVVIDDVLVETMPAIKT